MKRVKTFRFSEADLAVLDALSEEFGGTAGYKLGSMPMLTMHKKRDLHCCKSLIQKK